MLNIIKSQAHFYELLHHNVRYAKNMIKENELRLSSAKNILMVRSYVENAKLYGMNVNRNSRF